MNTLIVLLAAVASLLANPKVQANPALLAEVTGISQSANALVEEYTAINAPAPYHPYYPSSTYQTPPAQNEVDNPAPVLGDAATTNTETMGSVQIDGNEANFLSDGTPVFKTGVVSDAATCIVILDQNGNPITDASATITTDSLTNTFIPDDGGMFATSWTPLGSYMYGPVTQVNTFPAPNSSGCSYVVSVNSKGTQTFASAPGYHFLYDPPTDGLHQITVSALGSMKSVQIDSETTAQTNLNQ